MKLLIFFTIVGAGFWIWKTLARLIKARRRHRLLSAPFPEEWTRILIKNLPPYRHLPADLRQQLHDRIRIFIGEKSFEGCGGLELSDEIRVTIAAQACLLLLNRGSDCYPKLYSILVYPSTYVVGVRPHLNPQPSEASIRLGESWHHGAVVLAWDSVRQGAVNFADGHNVTMHEFAHQLDQQAGRADGTPILPTRSAYSSWSRVFSREYELLQRGVEKGEKSAIDRYGATNPAEFFAVATEIFFEKPRTLKKKHPELYRELQEFYRVDPGEWLEG